MGAGSFTIRAVYEGGVLKPRGSLGLAEGAEVVLLVRPIEDPALSEDDPSGWKAMRAIIGMWKDAPPDEPIAREHDRYLYGDERSAGARAAGTAPGATLDDDPTGWKTARKFIGLWKDAPISDLADDLDDYLYGPKK